MVTTKYFKSFNIRIFISHGGLLRSRFLWCASNWDSGVSDAPHGCQLSSKCCCRSNLISEEFILNIKAFLIILIILSSFLRDLLKCFKNLY